MWFFLTLVIESNDKKRGFRGLISNDPTKNGDNPNPLSEEEMKLVQIHKTEKCECPEIKSKPIPIPELSLKHSSKVSNIVPALVNLPLKSSNNLTGIQPGTASF